MSHALSYSRGMRAQCIFATSIWEAGDILGIAKHQEMKMIGEVTPQHLLLDSSSYAILGSYANP